MGQALRWAVWVVCAGIVGTMPAPALAQVDATLDATGLRYTLADLRPDDGLPASVTFSSTGRHADTDLEASRGTQTLYAQYTPDDDPAGTGLAADWRGAVGAESTLRPGTTFDVDALHAHSFAHPGDGNGYMASTRVYSSQTFHLAPYASLSLAVDMNARLRAVDSPTDLQYASVLGTFAGILDVGAEPAFDDGRLLEYAGAEDGGFTSARDVQTTLKLRFVNDTNAWADGYFAIDLRAVALSSPLAVPEPDAWAMAGAGLLTLGAIARRRASRKHGGRCRAGHPAPGAGRCR